MLNDPGAAWMEMSRTLVLPWGHLSPKHLFPEPTVRRVRNLEPLSVPLLRASLSTCVSPALAEMEGPWTEAGTGVEGWFLCCHFLDCCEEPKGSLASQGILCTSPWMRWFQQHAVALGLVEHLYLEKRVPAAIL